MPPAAPDWAALADELLAAAAHWSPTELRKVLADPAITERPWPLVRLAFLLAARDGGRTWTPRRLLSSGCPYWPRAARELAAAGGGGPLPDPAPPARPRPAPARELARPWCGQIDCDRTTRQQLDPGGAPMWDVQAGEFVACARCGPTAGIVQTAVGLP